MSHGTSIPGPKATAGSFSNLTAHESLGGLVRNEDSESVGLGGPKTLMCKELAGEAYAAGMWTTLCE